MKYLKSNDGIDHEFRLKEIDPETGEGKKLVIKGRWHHPKNITIFTDPQFEEILGYSQVTQLIERHVFQEIPDLPNNYWDARELAQQNSLKLEAQKRINKEKDETISRKDKEIEDLKKKMKENGLEVD